MKQSSYFKMDVIGSSGMGRRERRGWGGARKGAGRRALFKEPVTRWVKMERTEAEAVEKFAEERGISVAEAIRRAIRAYIQRRRRS